ncbi:MAG: hypothetical protein HKM24_03405 [Gammaproteobacteria bacterium]|nr:hypothetical protein [Gammaproteobacteria bacterium]
MIRFFDSNETAIQIIEARTFSPPAFEERHISEFGQFSKLQLPIRDQDDESEADKLFWQRLGLRDQNNENDDTLLTMVANDYVVEFNPRLRTGQVRLKFESDGTETTVDLKRL